MKKILALFYATCILLIGTISQSDAISVVGSFTGYVSNITEGAGNGVPDDLINMYLGAPFNGGFIYDSETPCIHYEENFVAVYFYDSFWMSIFGSNETYTGNLRSAPVSVLEWQTLSFYVLPGGEIAGYPVEEGYLDAHYPKDTLGDLSLPIDIDFSGYESVSLWICAWEKEIGTFPRYDFSLTIEDFNAHSVPLPSAILLLGGGLIGIVGYRRKFKR